MKNIIVIIISLLTVSCVKETTVILDVITPVSDGRFNALGSYLNVDNNGEIILNWSEEIDTVKTTILKYKMFDVVAGNFGEVFSVPSSVGMQSHHESMAKIARTTNGTLYALFRFKTPNLKNRFAGSIYYAISKDNGVTWSKKIKLVTDETAVSQSFFDITLLPDGELGLIWLDSRKLEKDKGGSTLYFAKTNQDIGFIDEKPIAGSTCQCCRTDIFVEDKIIHVAFRNITEGSIRDMYRIVSNDNGDTFTEPVQMGKDDWKIDGCPHTGPSFANSSKDLAVVWFTGAESGSGIFYKKITEDISLFNSKALVTITGRHPQMVASNDGNFYVVYEDFYKVEEQSYSKIVLHTLKSDGTEKLQDISVENTNNDHAVISKLSEGLLLISWTTVENKKTKIVYKIVAI